VKPDPRARLLPPRRHTATNVTRLLCAGAHLDRRFATAVISELVDHRDRYAAPAYGYDAVAVLGHALSARRRRRVRDACALLAAVPAAAPLVVGERWAPACVLLALWWLWAVAAIEAVARAQLLITRLKRLDDGDGDQVAFDRRVPYHPALLEQADRIVEDQSGSGVYYSGFVPFVGAGTLNRSWSFSVLLNGAPATAMGLIGHPGAPSGRRDTVPFGVAELTAYVKRRLETILRDRARPSERIAALTVEVRRYRTALCPERPKPLTGNGPDPVGSENYDSAREYLCVNVGSWGQELVTSIFVGFDVKGQSLHSELHSYTLLPIKAEFHAVDRLPADLSTGDVVAIASGIPARLAASWSSAAARLARRSAGPSPAAEHHRNLVGLALVSALIVVPATTLIDSLTTLLVVAGGVAALWLSTAVGRLAARRSTAREREPRRAAAGTRVGGRRRTRDWGARVSVRDLASEIDPPHFFQVVDQDKYTKVVERRLMDVIVDFLDDHAVDTTEYRSRQAAILNFGIMQNGGRLTNTGTVAMGAGNTAAAGPGQ
jgi:hypothetical protein